MGRKSRGKRQRRACRQAGRHIESQRVEELEAELGDLADGDFAFSSSMGLSERERAEHLEQILEFESTKKGTSLFEGLQKHGLDLPRPEELDERECALKSMEIAQTLAAEQRVFLVGFQHMGPRRLYSTLWNETLWEGCYLEDRNPAFVSIMDVSHEMSKAEIMGFMRELERATTVN